MRKKILCYSILGILLLVIGVLGFILYHNSKIANQLYLPSYTYQDYGTSLFAGGTWDSDTELANQLQTSKIQCFQERGTCTESRADTVFGILSVDTETYDIDKWTDSEISLRPYDAATCVKYVMHIDRVSKAITKTRSTAKTDGLCEGISQDSIYLHLEDGFKVWQKIDK